MWAEEVTVHFQTLNNCTILDILHFVPDHEGYLCLNRNITTIFTQIFPLQYAAHVTTFSGLIIQIIPHIIILCSKNQIWGTLYQRLLFCISIVIIPIGTGEIWLNSTCSHYHFGALAYIILIDLTYIKKRVTYIIYSVLLSIGSLSSPITCFLLPTFLFFSFINRIFVSKFLLITYTLCTLIQTFISFQFFAE